MEGSGSLLDIEKMLDEYAKKYKVVSMNLKHTGNLENDLARFILQKEGGIADDKSDSASKNPLKGTFTVNGKTYHDPHTNKGVTWPVFVDTAKAMGLSPTPTLFLNMPDTIPFEIFKKKYYAPFSNLSPNKLINYLVGLWAWGSGVGGAQTLYRTTNNKLNIQNLITKDKQLAFALLMIARLKFYEAISDENNPKYAKNAKYRRGWISAALNFYRSFKPYI